jgi:hypothetical protein
MRLSRWKIYLWIGWTFLVTGSVFLLVAIGFAGYEGCFLMQSSKAPGTVIANVQTQIPADVQTGTPAQTSFCPQFQYKSADGVTHIVTGSTGSNPPTFTVGEQVIVNYSKSDFADGQIDSLGEKWGWVLVFGLAAIVLTPVGIVLLRRLRSQGRSLDPISFWD